MASLDIYHRKRNFARTPEPAGSIDELMDLADSTKGGKFVIHKHDASRLHYDLRLEQNGVLTSWAVPKGPSLIPGEKRLAVKVEDHPLEYGDFEGTIPKEEYGGGTVMLWDRGRWAPLESEKAHKKKQEDRIDFVLAGEKLQGVWTLVKTSARDAKKTNQWLLIKRHDTVSDNSELTDLSVATGRSMEEIATGIDVDKQTKVGKQDSDSKGKKNTSSTSAKKAAIAPAAKNKTELFSTKGAKKKPLPKKMEAVLASPVKAAPEGEDWLHEIKFDGYRILATCTQDDVRLISRNANDWTRKFAEVREHLDKLAADQAILDGEIVALSQDGTSSFRNLQEALSARDTRGLVYQVFDILYLNGYDLTDLPLHRRKVILHQLLTESGFLNSPSVIRYTDHILGHGPEFFQQASQLGLEGIISKKVDSLYRGGRGNIWLKSKSSNHEEFLICGYTRPNGARKGFGALLLGAWQDGELIYTGRVGTGFSRNVLLSLYERLRDLASDICPLSSPPESEPRVRWVTPELVAEVEFTEWTRDGVLRHSSFRGLREDKNPTDIHLPDAAPQALVTKPAVTKRSSVTIDASPAPEPGTKKTSSKVRRNTTTTIAGVKLSNPDRILFPDQGITKLHLAQYYEEIADWILPHISRRPLSLVRCPDGRTGECFFQKHPRSAISEAIPRIDIVEKENNRTAKKTRTSASKHSKIAGNENTKPYFYVTTLPHLIGLVQAGALELHVWGSTVDNLECPDQLVFDLDPASDVSMREIFRVAEELKQRLDDLGLNTFLRVTGGKGLHLVVPLVPKLKWDEAKAFCRALAQRAASDDKKRLTANMSRSKRHGRTFIDYLRNGRGATAIASYSTRARPGAPVAVPISWDELNETLTPNRYTMENLNRRLGALSDDPWKEFDKARRPLTAKMMTAVGAKI